jgi:serine/threonine protein kinase
MLGCRAYSKAIDLWSVGCILAELLRRKPLFPGADYLDMLKMITMTIGSPTDADLHFVKSEKARAYMGKMAGKPKQPWSSMIKKANPMALDLLDKLLTWDPEKRLTVDVRSNIALPHCSSAAAMY